MQRIGLEAILDLSKFNAGLALFESGTDTIERAVGSAVGALDTLGGGIGKITDSTARGFDVIMDAVGRGAGKVKDSIGSGFGTIMDTIGRGAEGLRDSVSRTMGKIMDHVGAKIQDVLFAIGAGVFNALKDAAMGNEQFAEVMGKLGGKFDEIKGKVFEAIIPALTTLAEVLLKALSDPAVMAAVENISKWLAEKLPLAIAAFVGFVKDPLIPIIKDIAKFIEDPVISTIGAFVGFIKDPLIPAIKDIAKFIADPVISTIGALVDWFKVKIPEAVAKVTEVFGWVKTNILEPVAAAFDAIGDAVQWVIDKIAEVIEWFGKVGDSLPDWLVPGSPTPFELGVRGIGDAIREIQRMTMPTLSFAVPALSGATAGGSVTNHYRTVHLSMPATINNGMDVAEFQATVLRTVQQAVRYG